MRKSVGLFAALAVMGQDAAAQESTADRLMKLDREDGYAGLL